MFCKFFPGVLAVGYGQDSDQGFFVMQAPFFSVRRHFGSGWLFTSSDVICGTA